MTGKGDDTQLGFQDAPALPKPPEPKIESGDIPSPLGASLESLFQAGSSAHEEDASASIFDESPVGPMNSIDDIPEAIPNISDDGTEILAHGRAEVQEFTEEFGGEAVPTLPEKLAAAGEVASFVDSSFLVSLRGHDSTGPDNSLTEIIGGAGIDPSADTVVGDSPFREPVPAAFVSGEPAELSETFPASAESGIIDLPLVDAPDSTDDGGLSLSGITTAAVAGAVVASRPAPKREASSPPSGSSRTLLLALAGYAVVVTLLCVLLLSMLAKARNASRLESLPDLPPEPRGKMSLVPMQEDLPAGHTLALGDSQRFGHLRVEPLKVTRGSFRTVNTSGEQRRSRFDAQSDVGPVLLLWVKFTNESPDQAFVPLDAGLLFRRRELSLGRFQGNQFVVPKAERTHPDSSVIVYKPDSNDWELLGQQLGKTLQPGESFETYIPTDENGIDRLRGDLLWRVQLRKGHSRSGNGVTTIVEVAFRSDQIQSEGS